MIGPTGAGFVATLFQVLAVMILAAGAGMVMADVEPPEESGRFRRFFAGAWAAVTGSGFAAQPRCVIGRTLAAMRLAVDAGFVGIERTPWFGALFMGVVFLGIPLAALVNMIFGGSSLLVLFYLALAAALGILAITGERPEWKMLNGFLAVFLGASLFLLVPGYVLASFTERLQNTGFSHAVLGSVLVAPLYYLVAYGLLIAYRAMVPGNREPVVLQRFLAAVPAAFVLVFVALLAGHFAVFEQEPARPWRLLIAGIACTAAAVPLTMGLVEWGLAKPGRLAEALAAALFGAAGLADMLYMGATGSPGGMINVLAGLSVDGARVHLGPLFWVMHLPFLPILGIAGAVAVGWLAKGVSVPLALVTGPAETGPAETGPAERRPFRATGIVCACLAVLLWAAAAALS